ncbi:helix-turn-helix transcriptional regulator [Bacillus subtilis]|uniref:helix-turn-helix transcriptional regulator n=1 Tax=Bacillus subtilis TaxID=1423 RepID=UPI0037700C3C
MPKIKKYSYRTENKLKHFISIRKAEKALETGRQVKIADVENELAEYCEVSLDTIRLIKRNVNQPSLEVAMKIAEYLNLPVEEIFELKDND